MLLKREQQCLQNFNYDVARRVHELHVLAKFHGLNWFGYSVTFAEVKEEEEEEEDDEEFLKLAFFI